MGYSVNEMATLSGVSTRTLRFYEQKGLLAPKRRENGYREYGEHEVDRLQLILLFRRADMPVETIKQLMGAKGFDARSALKNHLKALEGELINQQRLIDNVKKTIACLEGGERMNDMEKFEGLKEKMLAENEEKYGQEIREKYGEERVQDSNKQFKNMSKEQFEKAEALSKEIAEKLKEAMAEGNPAGQTAQEACQAHKRWLCIFWPQGMYSKEAHMGLGQMYVDDERFAAYYDKIQPGAAVFLRDALNIFCK